MCLLLSQRLCEPRRVFSEVQGWVQVIKLANNGVKVWEWGTLAWVFTSKQRRGVSRNVARGFLGAALHRTSLFPAYCP